MIVGVWVGRGVFEGGRVKVFVGAFVKSYAYLVKSIGTRVEVNAGVNVGVVVGVFFKGALDGVLVSSFQRRHRCLDGPRPR